MESMDMVQAKDLVFQLHPAWALLDLGLTQRPRTKLAHDSFFYYGSVTRIRVEH